MNKLKFRAWSVKTKTMYILDPYEKYPKGTLGDLAETEEWKVMQFSGLLDKNEKEICDGDIVVVHIFTQECGENLGVMEGEKEFTVTITIKPSGVMLGDEPLFMYFNEDWHDMSEPFEVIGNIWENPELVNKED